MTPILMDSHILKWFSPQEWVEHARTLSLLFMVALLVPCLSVRKVHWINFCLSHVTLFYSKNQCYIMGWHSDPTFRTSVFKKKKITSLNSPTSSQPVLLSPPQLLCCPVQFGVNPKAGYYHEWKEKQLNIARDFSPTSIEPIVCEFM